MSSACWQEPCLFLCSLTFIACICTTCVVHVSLPSWLRPINILFQPAACATCFELQVFMIPGAVLIDVFAGALFVPPVLLDSHPCICTTCVVLISLLAGKSPTIYWRSQLLMLIHLWLAGVHDSRSHLHQRVGRVFIWLVGFLCADCLRQHCWCWHQLLASKIDCTGRLSSICYATCIVRSCLCWNANSGVAWLDCLTALKSNSARRVFTLLCFRAHSCAVQTEWL